jgi:glycosyltransferase involved in cell wall biosynthesis
MGLPVVASDVGEAKRMIGDAGFVVPCGGTQQMAAQVKELVRDKDRRSKFSAHARKIAETIYNWKSHTDALESAYHFALENKI